MGEEEGEDLGVQPANLIIGFGNRGPIYKIPGKGKMELDQKTGKFHPVWVPEYLALDQLIK